MSESESSPFNNSPDASMERFSNRQAFNQSTEGQVISVARNAEKKIRQQSEAERQAIQNAPDVVEEKSVFGIPMTKIKRWFKKT